MLDRNRAIIDGALVVAREAGADAVLLAGGLPEEVRYLEDRLDPGRRVIATTTARRNGHAADGGEVVVLPQVRLRRRGRAKVALMEGLAAGLLNPGECVVIISGTSAHGPCELDTVAVVDLDRDENDVLDGQAGAPLSILRELGDPAVFDTLFGLCIELGKEGKEGKPVGLLVTLGDHEAVLGRSRQLVLNPFAGHSEEACSILNPLARGAVREFSGMDGAFVVRSDGTILAAGRYLEDTSAGEQQIPPGLGARHRAGAGITATTRCISFVVSESTGDTRIFGGGRILMTVERTD